MKTIRKNVLALFGVAAVAACVFFAAPDVWFKLTHHNTPSEAQLREAFPGNSQNIIENASQLTLLSLDPGDAGGGGVHGKGTFHGYRVVGQTQLNGPEKSKLLMSLYNGMADNDERAACFMPRHGIHVVVSHEIVDLVICFHCASMITYADGKQGSSAVSKDTQKYFDGVLTNIGVPLSPR